jgi:hypothetical protein
VKTRSLWLCILAAALVAVLSLSAGCSAEGENRTTSGNAGNNNTGGSGGAGGGVGGACLFNCEGGGNPGGGATGALVISPAAAVLNVVDTNIPTQQFTATYNGADVTDQVAWVSSKPSMGSVNASGLFTPTGSVGGPGLVLALYNDDQAEADIIVNVKITTNTANVPPADITGFDNPNGGADPSTGIIYPYDKTVLPLRVLAPEVQWNGGNSGDVYRVRYFSQHMDYAEIVQINPQGLHLLTQQIWEDIEFSGTGPISDPLTVEITRKSGATIYDPVTIELRIAQGIIHGSVYYWQLPGVCGGGSNGQILRIKPSSDVTDNFFNTNDCFGCHTVSRDGAQMMATFSLGNPFPMQTLDLTIDPAVVGNIGVPTGITGVFAAFNDDGSKILYSNNSSSGPTAPSSGLNIIDAATGAAIVPNALGPGCGEPAWSPDGTMIAGICGMTNGGWTFDASVGNLTIGNMNGAQNQVMNQNQVVAQGALAGRPAYPSFSPDSKYIAYGRPTVGSRSTGQGTLWLTDVAGTSESEMVAASNDNQSFNPVFAPRSAGGYTWIVFISRRDYGNQLVNANRQQLWMTAVADNPTPGMDPSNPPFYLRGQQACGKSENAYYALDPCKADGETCEFGIECCNLSCLYDDVAGETVCKDPDPNECIATGNGVCTTDADCCDVANGVICNAGICELAPPQ